MTRADLALALRARPRAALFDSVYDMNVSAPVPGAPTEVGVRLERAHRQKAFVSGEHHVPCGKDRSIIWGVPRPAVKSVVNRWILVKAQNESTQVQEFAD